jgi:hypothetical protein
MPSLTWDAVGIFGVLLLVPLFLWAVLGLFDAPAFDSLAWLRDNARWGQRMCFVILAGLLSKIVFEEHRDIEDRLSDVEADLAWLKEMHPQMLIEISEANASRGGRIHAKVSSDSKHRTVHGVRLAITKAIRDSDGSDVLPPTPYQETVLRSIQSSESVSINSGAYELFDLASYDAMRRQIQIGHHNDPDGFSLPADTYTLKLCCTGSDLRAGGLECIVGVSDGQLTYKVI